MIEVVQEAETVAKVTQDHTHPTRVYSVTSSRVSRGVCRFSRSTEAVSPHSRRSLFTTGCGSSTARESHDPAT